MNRKKQVTLLPSMYMNVASFNSWNTNNDGEGMLGFRTKHINKYRSVHKLIYRQGYWLLATHQRFGTSGTKGVENAHPFETDHLVLMHNGIISGLGTKDASDTKVYVDILENEYQKDLDIAQAINRTNLACGGSYSVIVYVKGTGKVYYYKNSGTRMSAIMGEDWLVMSTDSQNVEYAKRFFRTYTEVKVQDNTLYDVTAGLKPVCVLKEKPPQIYNTYDKKWRTDPLDEWDDNGFRKWFT